MIVQGGGYDTLEALKYEIVVAANVLSETCASVTDKMGSLEIKAVGRDYEINKITGVTCMNETKQVRIDNSWDTIDDLPESICSDEVSLYIPVQNGFTHLLNSIIKDVKAQKIEVVDPGVYEISGTDTQAKTYEVTTEGLVKYFYDDNKNGIKDEGEEYLTDAESSEVSVNIKKIAELESYRMNVGWNVVSFPMVMTGEDTSEISKASELLNSLNQQGANVTHITSYREGDFVIYSERDSSTGSGQDKVTFGEDYVIMPGEAYFIKNYESATVKFKGKKVEGSMEILMNPGWNLISVYNEEVKSYGGFEVISQMNTQGVNAEVISKWEDGQYSNILIKAGTEYGTDFKVYPTSGYWVKNISKDSGKFKPM